MARNRSIKRKPTANVERSRAVRNNVDYIETEEKAPPQERAQVTKVKKVANVKSVPRSEAKALPRGIDLGVNVRKIFDDSPKTMNDYVERERLRRAKGVTASNVSKNVKSKPSVQKSVAVKPMNRIQMKKEIKIDNERIGGSRTVNRPMQRI